MSGDILQRAEAAIGSGDRLSARFLLSKLLATEPRNARALQLLSAIELAERNFPAARDCLERLLSVDPENAAVQGNLGMVALQLGENEVAEAAFEKTISLQSSHAGALYNLGQIRRASGHHDSALKLFRKLSTADPKLVVGWEALCETLLGLGRLDDAIAACERASRHARPTAHLLRIKADALRRSGKTLLAEAGYRAALALEPDNIDLLHNLAGTLYKLGNLEEALELYEREFQVAGRLPNNSHALQRALVEGVRLRLALARWDDLEIQTAQVLAILRASPEAVDPLLTVLLTDERKLLLASARAAWGPAPPATAHSPSVRAAGRIRVGYLSADFQDHPVSHLMSRVFELHDRSAFEVHAYSAGHDLRSPYRRRIERSVETFRDVRHLTNSELAAIISRDELDLLIDLSGHTRNNRLAVLQHRPARATAHFLGFPGSLGNQAVDYFIADGISLSNDIEHHFDEAIVRLPGTYHPTDNALPIPKPTKTRSQYGLPEDAFVFCAFVQTSKLNPDVFDAYAEILRAAPNSVLWLAEDQQAVIDRLRAEAWHRQVDGSRLVFASRESYADNLNRLVHADLVLDTWPYGGHTTTSNALWAGVPVLTKHGTSFASRAPASIISAAGVSSLIAADREDFVRMATLHATDKAQHLETRGRLAAKRSTCRLFDTRQFVLDFERAILEIARRAKDGLPPKSFSVCQSGVG